MGKIEYTQINALIHLLAKFILYPITGKEPCQAWVIGDCHITNKDIDIYNMHTTNKKTSTGPGNIIYFDLETQKSAREVGGWAHIDRMKLAIAVTFSTADQQYTTFQEEEVEQLINQLTEADLIVGFNLKGFDYVVLRPYTRVNLWQLSTFDMLEHVKRALGFRLSLDALAKETLREAKSADGLQSLRWWKAGKVGLVAEYCRKDVEITKRLHEYACQNGHLLFRGRDGKVRRVNTTGW